MLRAKLVEALAIQLTVVIHPTTMALFHQQNLGPSGTSLESHKTTIYGRIN
jgi:hypothetical protein